MAHVYYGLNNPKKQTNAMMLGSALDDALFSPSVFLDKYAIGPDGDRGTKKWKAEQEAVGEAVTLLKPDEHARIIGMAESLRSFPASSKLFAAPGDLQLALLWEDKETGLMCKAKLDKLCAEDPFVIDLKSTDDAEEQAFSRTALNMGYDRQGAMYIDGCEACNVPGQYFILPVVEQDRPHPVAVYNLGAASIELGRIKNRRALREYAQAKKTGFWPGFPNRITPLEVPAWALRGIDVTSTFERIG
jgi:hypothetical protein